MTVFKLILEFFTGLFILFAVGWLIGHIFKFDQYLNHAGENESEVHIN